PLATDPVWFRRSVFYEVLVRGFFDSNDDGTGDLRGITAKLDFLSWLGVGCIWLLPFYQSPLRDGGYDISDFFTILPEYGNLADAVELVEEAHRRGIRIVAGLVMNHTSDQHPWFQESRQDAANPKADWYVWSDDDQRWPEARIIFVDTEKSNWTWDAQRQQYYWHRFFTHQPDLNYDNPEVASQMLDVVRFWLDIPDGCQWAMFLRNHDELTLEMVTDEERDYMYSEYAKDPRMRRNIGIGRRLATLVDNDRRVGELLHSLLFSMPGSPILYYGDELLMGDNIYLGDRDSVRTPMQWSPDRNAGFSRADFAQPCELQLAAWEGRTPVELLGRVPFPRIGDLPYFITLGPYSFYWLQLVEEAT